MSAFISFLIAGVVTGSIYAVTASGLVVTYNTTGIFNFAHGAVGTMLAFAFWQMWQGWHWPVLLALAVTLLLLAPIFGALIERGLMRPLYGAAASTQLVVTIGLFLVLFGVTTTVWKPTVTRSLPEFFEGHQVSLGNVNLSYEQVITVAVAAAVAIGLRLLFKTTRTGVAMRAVVDDPDLASLTGARAARISRLAWMIGVMLAGLAGVLLAPSVGMNIPNLSEIVIYGYAAAVVGRLRSLPLTFVGAMILGIATSMIIGYAPASVISDLTTALPMAMLLVVLLVLPEARLTVGRIVHLRPPRIASGRQTVIGGIALVAAVGALAQVLTGNNLYTLGLAMVLGLAALSLTLLSGYGGQVWLCQYTFLGLGAFAMAKVSGGTSVLGLIAAVGLCAASGVILALPALRLRGLYLALATLAFAALMDGIFFTSTHVMGAGGTLAVGRPDIFGARFRTNQAFDVLLAAVLALCMIGVGALRRGSFGRRLVGMTDSQAACATLGMSLTRTKVAVFAISGGLAGLAGALYGGLGTTVGAAQLGFINSLVLFVGVVLAGASVLSGALLAGVSLAVVPLIAAHFTSFPGFTYVLFGVGIVAIGRNPYGIGRLYGEVGSRWRSRHVQVDPPGGPRRATTNTEVSRVG